MNPKQKPLSEIVRRMRVLPVLRIKLFSASQKFFFSCYVIFILIFNQSAVVAQERTSASLTDSFKAYLQECPAVKTIVFQRRVLSVPNIPGENVPNSVTNDFKVYVGAWQANGFFLREIRSLKDLNTVIDTNTFTADLLLSGRIGAKWWDVVNTQITSWHETLDGKSSAVRRKAELAESVLYPVLRFGINNLKPGTLVWNGNEFSAQSTAGKVVKGRLTISNSVPWQMEVYNADSRIPSYICEYKYDNLTLNFSNHFPSTILRSRIVNGVKTPIWVAAIFEIEIAKEEAPMSRFEPDNFVNRHDAINYIQTNGIEFKVTSNTLLKLPGIDLSPEMPASNTTKNARLLILGCSTMSGLIFITLFLWKKNKH